MRVIVTASRDWADYGLMAATLSEYHADGNTLVVGRGGNGDHMAERIAVRLGWAIDPHPADWDRHGKRAGFLRNKEMVDTGGDILLAFIRPCRKPNCPDGPGTHDSHGAAHTLGLATAAGIATVVQRRR